MKNKAFNNWRHNSIKLTFPNGNSLSTIWGACTYSDNQDFTTETMDDHFGFQKFLSSDTVEVMILKAPEKLIKRIHKKFNGDGSVIGHLTMEQWLEIVKMLSK
jgi:hypothetical protein